jgi:hypothetical protein
MDASKRTGTSAAPAKARNAAASRQQHSTANQKTAAKAGAARSAAALAPAVAALAGAVPLPESTGPAVHGRLVRTPYGVAEVFQREEGAQEWQFPAGGNFDVVLVQQSANDTIPGAEEFLVGKPVHTVYLWNESATHWVLQYSLPAGAVEGPSQSGMVVSLGREPKLEAPFVQTSVVPPPQRMAADRPALFRGILTAGGRFERLQAVHDATYQPRGDLLPYLQRWRFRPARLDGAPVTVEILLLVPGSSGE